MAEYAGTRTSARTPADYLLRPASSLRECRCLYGAGNLLFVPQPAGSRGGGTNVITGLKVIAVIALAQAGYLRSAQPQQQPTTNTEFMRASGTELIATL